jgi:hypothetical protein
MASDPLFDNRYRYDHIYPRGRSGETLRAVDTRDQERKVVIKRPAPQDAPPLRAAQAVSIAAEKKALERLSGHRCLTELRGSGEFRAGGSSYLYIVMDRAEGTTLESLVLGLAAQQQPLPALEGLVILDHLLDLLMAAHSAHVVYNDVDAKHLFWDRERYRLKVIDWGNAVFTDEASHPAQITPANDIYQVGELLYFIYQGGARLAGETTPEGDYHIAYQNPAPPPEVQEIIFKATHPNSKAKRYAHLRLLRDDLSKVRTPLERGRDQTLQAVQRQLTDQASQALLERLDQQLEEALALDPGYPAAQQLHQEIRLRLQYIAVQADFDAARIYLETGNWSRAANLIESLIPKADPRIGRALRLLADSALQFEQSGQTGLPDEFNAVIEAVLEGKNHQAARVLMSIAQHDSHFGDDALLIAERLIALMPDVLLLRPNLARLTALLGRYDPALAQRLEALPASVEESGQRGIATLAERYAKVAIQLADEGAQLEKISQQQRLGPDVLLAPSDRAQQAAQRVVALLRQVANSAYTNPDAAADSLESARLIDPANPHIPALAHYLGEARQAIEALRAFRPSADGSDILAWASASRANLEAYSQDLNDPNYVAIVQALRGLEQNWAKSLEMLILGRKAQPADLLLSAAKSLRLHNSGVADWLENSALLIKEAREPERFAANQTLANTLIDGYQAWDQGQLGRSADLARRATQDAQSEAEQLAAQRLETLASLTSAWLNEGGIQQLALTEQTEKAVLGLFLKEEAAEYERFSHQMPSEETYLKAMKLGIVSFMQQSSAVGYRALFFYYLLRGALDMLEDNLDSSDFWRQAALIAYPDARTHPAFNALDTEITRRKLTLRAEAALAQVQQWADLPDLKATLNAPLAESQLKEAHRAVGLAEETYRLWSDGDFRTARDYFSQAFDLLAQAEANGLAIAPLRQFLTPYRERTLEMLERKQLLDQAAMVGSTKADPDVLRALEQMVEIAERTFGTESARQVKIWRDLYRTMLKTHSNTRLTKREKLAEFEGNFAALFIDRHPAYRLFQQWYEAARALPDDVQEALQIQVESGEDSTLEAPTFEDDAPNAPQRLETGEDFEDEIKARRPIQAAQAEKRPGPNWNRIILAATVILMGLIAAGVYRYLSQPTEGEVFSTIATSERFGGIRGESQSATALAQSEVILPSNTPTASKRSSPTLTLPPTIAPSNTPLPISATPSPLIPTIAPTLTPTPFVTIITNTPPPTATFTATSLPPTMAEVAINTLPTLSSDPNTLNLLGLLGSLQPDELSWDARFFNQGAGGVWQLGATIETAGAAPIAVILDPDFLGQLNPALPGRLSRVEVAMELTLYDEERLSSQQVYFGIALQNQSRQRYGAQVQVRQATVVSFGINENGSFKSISQLPLAPIQAVLAIQRESDDTLSFYVNGQRLGGSPALFPADQPISVVLYNAGGGMFVSVSALTLQLTP